MSAISPAVTQPLSHVKSYDDFRKIFQQENLKKMLRDVKKDSRSTSLNQKNKKTTEFIQDVRNEVQRAKFHEELMQSKQKFH